MLPLKLLSVIPSPKKSCNEAGGECNSYIGVQLAEGGVGRKAVSVTDTANFAVSVLVIYYIMPHDFTYLKI